jgi:hypothetical protein
MFNFFKTGIEFNNLAKEINGMNVALQDLIPKIERSYNHSEFSEEIMVLAYVARRGVLDRLEKYNWTMDAKISVPTIDRGQITLMYALSQTVVKLQILSVKLEMSDIVEEIMERGDAYYQLERILPKEVTENF